MLKEEGKMRKIGFAILFVCSSILSANLALAELKDGLVAFYPFNGNANDESGNGKDGIVDGATLTKDRYGHANKAYSFDGNDFIEIDDIYVINDRDISISLWIKFQDNNHDNQFLTNGSIQDSDPNYFVLTYNNDSSEEIRIATRDGEDWVNLYSNNKYALNQWYHIVFTRSGGEGKIYINGTLEKAGIVLSGDIGDHHDWFIGKGLYDDRGFFKGEIDEVRIYNRVLSNDEIVSLYKVPKFSVGMPFIPLLLLANSENECISNPYFNFCVENTLNWESIHYKRKETVKRQLQAK
jgi:hypothetical protein